MEYGHPSARLAAIRAVTRETKVSQACVCCAFSSSQRRRVWTSQLGLSFKWHGFSSCGRHFRGAQQLSVDKREREREREEKGVLRLFHISLVTADDTPTPLLEHAKDGAAAAAKSCCWADLTFWEKEFHEEKQKSFQWRASPQNDRHTHTHPRIS